MKFVDLIQTEAEIRAAIADIRSWLHDEDVIYLPSARTQIAEQLIRARQCLRDLRGIPDRNGKHISLYGLCYTNRNME